MAALSSVVACMAIAGCASVGGESPLLSDETPEFVTPGALDCVVPLLLAGVDGQQSLGSGVVIAPDLLLTADHVLDAAPRARDRITLSVDGVTTGATILAALSRQAPHGDWAVLQLDEATRAPPARLHQPAREPDWQPAPGTEVLLVGYALGFFTPDAGGEVAISVDDPTPCVRATIRSDPRPDCWIASTSPRYLGGMSGGAAMVWNVEEQRAEVIGLLTSFVPWVETVTTTTTRRAPSDGPRTMVREVSTLPYQIRRLPPMIANPVTKGR